MVVGGESTVTSGDRTSASHTVDLQDPRRPCMPDLVFPYENAGAVGAFVGGMHAHRKKNFF